MSASLKHYLKTIENSLKAGNATEHTHRPALKAMLETLDLQITATNEPKRIACGAPDYIISRAGLTIGYIEAKDVGKSLAETERTDQLKRYRLFGWDYPTRSNTEQWLETRAWRMQFPALRDARFHLH